MALECLNFHYFFSLKTFNFRSFCIIYVLQNYNYHKTAQISCVNIMIPTRVKKKMKTNRQKSEN